MSVEAIVRSLAHCEVPVARTSEEGLRVAEERAPDAIVLCADVAGGYGTCRRLKKDAVLREVPLVLISAVATPAQFEDHQRLPTRADVYLHKPLEPGAIARALEGRLPAGSAASVEPPELPEDDAPGFGSSDPRDTSAALLRSRVAELSAAHSDLLQRHREQTAKAEEAARARAAAEERLAALQKAYERAEQAHAEEAERLSLRVAKLERESEARTGIDPLQAAELNRLREELARAEGDQSVLEAAVADLRAHNKRVEGQASTLREENAALTEALEGARADLRRLEALNADLVEALQAVADSLRTPQAILERYRELAGAAPGDPPTLTSQPVARVDVDDIEMTFEMEPEASS